MRGIVGALVALFMANAAAAQVCPEVGTILSLADRILAGRTGLGRLQQRNYGTEAAYLKLMYGGIARPGAQALFGELAAAQVRDAGQAGAALAVAGQGLAGLAALDPDPARALTMGGPSTARAAMLADPAGYFALLADAGAWRGQTAGLALAPLRIAAVLVADQPDPVRLAIAEAAEAAGRLQVAAQLYADMADLTAYEAFRIRHAGDPVLELAGSPDLEGQGAGLRSRDAPVPWDRAPDYADAHRQYFRLLKGAYIDGQSGFLTTVVNQTGDIAAGIAAAEALLAAVAADLNPAADPEAGWALAGEALAAAMGVERLRSTLAVFDWPLVKVRHYAGTAEASLAVVLARQALAPVARGEGPPPEPPALLPAGFPWEIWVAVAQGLATDGQPTITGPDERLAAIELLDALGRSSEAADFAGPVAEAMPVWRDLIQRLDRRCQGFTAHPGQALWLGGGLLYKY